MLSHRTLYTFQESAVVHVLQSRGIPACSDAAPCTPRLSRILVGDDSTFEKRKRLMLVHSHLRNFTVGCLASSATKLDESSSLPEIIDKMKDQILFLVEQFGLTQIYEGEVYYDADYEMWVIKFRAFANKKRDAVITERLLLIEG